MNIVELITDLRGGAPETCDFCGQPFDARGAIPEEAGDWACYPCWDYWEKNEGKARPLETKP